MKALRHKPILMLATLAVLASLVMWIAAPLGFPFELTRHFTPHLAMVSCVLALVNLAYNIRLRALVAGLASAIFGWAWLTVPFQAPDANAGPDRITVAVFNARYSPEALARGALWAREQGVDIIMLAEAHGISDTRLRELYADWPYSRMSDADISLTGANWHTRTAVFSSWPVSDTLLAQHKASGFSRPVISLDVAHPAGDIQITGLHPFPPGTPFFVLEQHAMFKAVANHVPAHERFVVMGDMNTTVWSPNYTALPGKRAGDPRFATTFPAPVAVGGIAIDHIMAGDGFTVTRAERGPFLGSDHYPIMAELAFNETDNER